MEEKEWECFFSFLCEYLCTSSLIKEESLLRAYIYFELDIGKIDPMATGLGVTHCSFLWIPLNTYGSTCSQPQRSHLVGSSHHDGFPYSLMLRESILFVFSNYINTDTVIIVIDIMATLMLLEYK